MKRVLPIGLLFAAAPAFAHTPGEAGTTLGWSFEFWVAVPLALTALAYAAAVWRLHRYGIRRRVVSIAQCCFFALGLLSLVLALMSPLDALAEQLFSAHMSQHLMLMLVAPPLLILGRPQLVLLWTFRLRVRRAIGRVWRGAGWLRSICGISGSRWRYGCWPASPCGSGTFPDRIPGRSPIPPSMC